VEDMNKDILEDITALADKEIRDKSREKVLFELIRNDEEVGLEYEIQTGIKSLMRERFASGTCPTVLMQKITSTLKNETRSRKKYNLFSSGYFGAFSNHPVIAFATVLLVLGFAYLYSDTFSDQASDLIKLQSGENNMYVQASANFSSIISGKLLPQLSSSDIEENKKFLHDSGVEYLPDLPTPHLWKLSGSVVSECSGRKYAHNVYSGGGNQIIYLFQAENVSCSNKNELNLSRDLIDYLAGHSYLKVTDGENCSYIWQNNDKIFMLFANFDKEELPSEFISASL